MRKSVFLFLFMLTCLGYSENLIKNGGFELIPPDGTLPLHWTKSSYKNGEGSVQSVKSDQTGRGRVLQIQQSSEQGLIGCNQVISLPKPLADDYQAVVSWRVSALDLKIGSLVLTAGNQQKKVNEWHALQYFKGSFDWRKMTEKVKLKKGTTRLCISVRANRPGGMLLVDDVSLTLEKQSVPAAAELVRNGRLQGHNEELTGLPDGWKMKFYYGLEAVGKGSVLRKNNQENVLCLQWISGARRFGAEPELLPVEGGAARYHVSAEVKCSEGAQALFAVEMYDRRNRKIEELFSQPVTFQEWRTASFDFSSLPDTAKLHLFCLSGNTGSVQFRRISCRRLSGKASVALPLDAMLLPVSGNRAWNGGRNEFTSFIEAPLPLTFHFKGQKKQLKAPELTVEIPADLYIADSFCMHFGRYGKEHPLVQQTRRAEGRYTRYIFRDIRPFHMLLPTYGWSRKLTLAISPVNEKAHPGRYRIFWQLGDRTRRSEEHSFDFNLVHWPETRQKLPDFPIWRWGCEDHLFTSDKIVDQVASVYEQCNLNAEVYYYPDFPRGREINDRLKKRGWYHYRTIGNFNYVKYMTQEQLERLKDKLEYCVSVSGIDKKRLCPSYIIDDRDFHQVFADGLKKAIASLKMSPGEMILLDIEPWQPFDRCFCNRCRRKFADYVRQKRVPTMKEIKKHYHAQWIQFSCANTAEQIAMHRRVMKQYFPDLKMADYDYIVDFSRPDYKKSYYAVAKDPELSEKYFDMHLASYYHTIDKKAFEMIRINSRRLQKAYMPVCAIDAPGRYLTSAEVLSPDQARLMLLGAAVNGSAGFAIYPGLHLDGAYLLAFNRALRELGPWMYLFRHSRRDARNVTVEKRPFSTREIMMGGVKRIFSLPQWESYVAHHAFAVENKTVATVFNYHPEHMLFADVKVDTKPGQYAVILNGPEMKRLTAPSGKAYWNSEELRHGIPVKVGAREVRFILIRDWLKQDRQLREAESVHTVEQDFRKMIQVWSGRSGFKPLQSGKLSISLADRKGDGEPELQMRTSDQTVCIDYRHGGAINFLENGKEKSAAVLSIDKLWLPREVRGELSGEAAIVKSEIKGDVISVELKKEAVGIPLKILRTYQLKDRQPGLKLTWKVTNTGSDKVSFCWWNAACFPVRADEKDCFQYFSDGKWMNLRLPENGSTYFAMENAVRSGLPKQVKMWPGSRAAATVGRKRLEFRHEAGQLMSYYYWQSPLLNTWEWIYQSVSLQPGESKIFHQTVLMAPDEGVK